MKEKSEIIRDLEDQILFRLENIKIMQQEIDAMQLTVNTFRKPTIEAPTIKIIENSKKGNKLNEYPGYPIDGDLWDKFHYLEDLKLKFWRSKYMEALISEIEGDELNFSYSKEFQRILFKLVKKAKVINMKYCNSVQYCFYSTRIEWIEPIQIGTMSTYRVLPDHAPEKIEIMNLSEDQVKPERIQWGGIK